MSNLQIPLHLKTKKKQLHSLLISEFIDVKYVSQDSVITFLKKHNLILEDIQLESKWKVRCSIKIKGIYILQCCCESDMDLKKPNQEEKT
ncbi:hypothetical protein RclHR1_07340002 [Rhizophagus clarus]|uniref:Uncharacterized protein n=1 Tax=Rhizophagus clarus TaxID=94130 RepID=A0A2Z6RWC3_9GLOM|nr:hypothetical protein RclHR1_07340002 [Rhizophagus clarus]GES91539.1 hypothetical protein GLOIN_2v1883656 [Rhizophagus clarus]